MTRIDVADVVSEKRRFSKAKVKLDTQRGTMLITDRRGRELVSAEGSIVGAAGTFEFVAAEPVDGEQRFTIKRLSTCGCGGTKVVDL